VGKSRTESHAFEWLAEHSRLNQLCYTIGHHCWDDMEFSVLHSESEVRGYQELAKTLLWAAAQGGAKLAYLDLWLLHKVTHQEVPNSVRKEVESWASHYRDWRAVRLCIEDMISHSPTSARREQALHLAADLLFNVQPSEDSPNLSAHDDRKAALHKTSLSVYKEPWRLLRDAAEACYTDPALESIHDEAAE
jgi:hypothetical protein